MYLFFCKFGKRLTECRNIQIITEKRLIALFLKRKMRKKENYRPETQNGECLRIATWRYPQRGDILHVAQRMCSCWADNTAQRTANVWNFNFFLYSFIEMD